MADTRYARQRGLQGVDSGLRAAGGAAYRPQFECKLSVLENGSMNFVSMNPGIAECFRAGCSSTSN